VIGRFALALVGIAGGLAIGTAVMAIYSVFDFVSALNVFSNDSRFPERFEWMVMAGAMLSTAAHLFGLSAPAPKALLPVAGLGFGAFVGLLAEIGRAHV
jgi:stage V sporulation protein AB